VPQSKCFKEQQAATIKSNIK